MAQKVREIMTAPPVCLRSDATAWPAASRMREHGIGDVIVVESGGKVCGVLTDRDLVVRVMAAQLDPERTTLEHVCSREDVATIASDDDIDEAITLMRERAIRRLPVVEQGRPVGVISLGDLALERDEASVLAAVSAAPTNR
jgi:CBS domain-containing protein